MKKFIAVFLLFFIFAFLLVSCTTQQPSEILIAEIDGSRLYLNDLLSEIEYWIYLYGMDSTEYGSELSDENALPTLERMAEEQFNALLAYHVALAKARELRFDGLTESELSEIQQNAAEDLANTADYYEDELRQKYDSLSEEKLQTLLEAELSAAGYSEAQLISYYTNSLIYEKIYSYYTDALTLDATEVEAGAAQLAEQAKENYAADPSRYDYDTFFGATIYYTPANVRRVKHILIALEEEDAAAVQSAYEAEDTQTAEALLNEALEKIRGEAEEVYARIQLDPAQFDSVMYELTDDTEVTENPNGYYIYQESSFYHPSFIEAAFNLKTEGDISGLVATSSGYHILQLEEIVTEGPTPLEDIYSAAYETLLTQKKEAYFSQLTTQWQEEFSIKTYPKRYLNYLEKHYQELIE